MSVKSKIWNHLMSRDKEKAFCTREVLFCGSRSAVDGIMSLLVNTDFVERLSWGVFRLSAKTLGYELPPLSDEEIAMLKAEAFDHIALPVLADDDDPREPVRSVPASGVTTRFRRVVNRREHLRWIELRHVADRKAALRRFTNGIEFYKIWRMGEAAFINAGPPVPSCKSTPDEIPKLCALLPWWITRELLIATA